MYGKTSGVTAGAGKAVQLQAVNKIIIKSLSNRIVIFGKYGYHSVAAYRLTYGV